MGFSYSDSELFLICYNELRNKILACTKVGLTEPTKFNSTDNIRYPAKSEPAKCNR